MSSGSEEDSPYYIPRRHQGLPPRMPTPPPPMPVAPTPTQVQVPGVGALHITVVNQAPQPQQATGPQGPLITPRPWYFTGSGFFWLILTLGIIAAGLYFGWQWLEGTGWF